VAMAVDDWISVVMRKGEHMLEATGLNVAFGGEQVLFDVAFQVEAGEIVGFFGPNGSGKSTALRAIAGILPYEGGSLLGGAVRFQGEDIACWSAAGRACGGIRLLTQRLNLFESMSVEDNLRMGALAITGEGSSSAGREHLMRLFEVEGLRRARVRVLSSGERARVALARLFGGGGRLFLLDEPTAGLSERGVERLVELIEKRSREEGAAFIVVEQRISSVQKVVQRHYYFEAGRATARLGVPEAKRL